MTKFGELKSIGHNIADSFASGIGLMIGYYEIDVFKEAGRSKDGHITIDFLTGRILSGRASRSLSRAAKLYANALPELCKKHGASVHDLKTLKVRFGSNLVQRPHFVVTVENNLGKKSEDIFTGIPGQKVQYK
ncbi:hypothetical protein ACFOOP_12020 [Marinicaulis aureus]|uniref:Uncharacterized protein n=1 Tax=Hyphococcus aureus TaxID=2666033 RepID=A0ABW1L2V1_9PROT